MLVSRLASGRMSLRRMGGRASMEPAGNHGSSIVTPEDVADSEVHRALETSTLCFRRESVNGGLAALFYGTTSTVAVVVNKMILTTYGWNLHWLFFLCQIIFSLVALQTLVYFGFLKQPTMTIDVLWKVMPLTGVFILNVFFGLTGLQGLHLAEWTVFRRLTSFFVLMLEWALLRKTSSVGVVASVCIMVAGAICLSANDLSRATWDGAPLILMNNFFTSLQLVLIKRTGMDTCLSSTELMIINNVLALPIVVLVLVSCTTELQQVLSYQHLHLPSFQLAFLLSCAQIVLLHYATFLCTTLNSPLTTNVTGHIKNIATTAMGFVFFDSTAISLYSVWGIALGLVGSVLYSISKLRNT